MNWLVEEGSCGGERQRHQAASLVMVTVVDDERNRQIFLLPLYFSSFTSFRINNWFSKTKLVYLVIYQ